MAKKFYRSSTNKIFAGVCGGLGEYFNIDPSIIRLFWLLLSISTGGTGLLVYIICAIVIPENNIIYYDKNENNSYKNSGLFVGIMLILIGGIILLKKFYPWFDIKTLRIAKYWPILLIIAGIYIIYNENRNK